MNLQAKNFALDRRVSRTRRALREALVTLLRARDYDDFTVQDLLEIADVGRSTFYAHFSSKDELLRYGLKCFGTEVRTAAECVEDRRCGFQFVRPLLEHIAGHRELFRHIKGRGAEVHRQELNQILTELTRRAVCGPEDAFDALRELDIQFAKGALYSVIMWWLERNSTLSVDEVEAEFLRLIRSGFGKF